MCVMLTEMIYSINSYFTTIPDIGSMPAEMMPLSILFSLAGALILGRFTGSMGGLTFPINFSAMFIGATLSNWLLGGVKLTVADPVQQPMLFSMMGMIAASLLMIRWLQRERAHM